MGSLPSEWIRPTAVQLDHFHAKPGIKELAKDPERAARWWGYVARGNLEALGRSLAPAPLGEQPLPERPEAPAQELPAGRHPRLEDGLLEGQEPGVLGPGDTGGYSERGHGSVLSVHVERTLRAPSLRV